MLRGLTPLIVSLTFLFPPISYYMIWDLCLRVKNCVESPYSIISRYLNMTPVLWGDGPDALSLTPI